MARPRAGEWLEDEIAGLRTAGVDVLLSLLTEPEVAELGLEATPHLCQKNGIEYLAFPIPDRGVPASMAEALALVDQLHSFSQEGKQVAIHCRAGLGRSALIAACLLVRDGFEVDEAFSTITRSRGLAVPDTQEQKDWAGEAARTIART